jgi:hypothetical protein
LVSEEATGTIQSIQHLVTRPTTLNQSGIRKHPHNSLTTSASFDIRGPLKIKKHPKTSPSLRCTGGHQRSRWYQQRFQGLHNPLVSEEAEGIIKSIQHLATRPTTLNQSGIRKHPHNSLTTSASFDARGPLKIKKHPKTSPSLRCTGGHQRSRWYQQYFQGLHNPLVSEEAAGTIQSIQHLATLPTTVNQSGIRKCLHDSQTNEASAVALTPVAH